VGERCPKWFVREAPGITRDALGQLGRRVVGLVPDARETFVDRLAYVGHRLGNCWIYYDQVGLEVLCGDEVAIQKKEDCFLTAGYRKDCI